MKKIIPISSYLMIVALLLINSCKKKDGVSDSSTEQAQTQITVTAVTNINLTAGTADITGTNFSPIATEDTVKFNNILAQVLTASATTLSVKLPTSGNLSGLVSVKVRTSTVVWAPTSYVSPTRLTTITPDTGLPGDTVIIQGWDFLNGVGANMVKFNGTTATLVSAQIDKIVAIVPAGATTGPITVLANNAQTLTGINFTVAPAAFAWRNMGSIHTNSTYTYHTASAGEKLMIGVAAFPTVIWYSSDGTSFTEVTSNLPFSTPVTSIKQISSNGSSFYVATNLGLATTTNGVSWSLVFNPATYGVTPISLSFIGTDMYLSTSGTAASVQTQFYKSIDNGATWTKLSDIPNDASAVVKTADNTFYSIGGGLTLIGSKYSIPVSPRDPDYDITPYKSTNLGLTWTKCTPNIGYLSGTPYVAVPLANNLYMFKQNDYHVNSDAGMYKSTDGATTWVLNTTIPSFVGNRDNQRAIYTKNNNIYIAGGLQKLSVLIGGTTYQSYDLPANSGTMGMIKTDHYVYLISQIPIQISFQIFRSPLL